MIGEIIYNNKAFPFRNIFLEELDSIVTISTSELNSILINDKGEYNSESAKFIDEQIYFFVDKEQMDLPEEQFVILLKKTIQ